jgi:hypothetical protein
MVDAFRQGLKETGLGVAASSKIYFDVARAQPGRLREAATNLRGRVCSYGDEHP